MKIITTGDFKENLASVLKDIMEGEEYTISYGKKKEKVAVILPYSRYMNQNPRKLGLRASKGSFKVTIQHLVNIALIKPADWHFRNLF